MKGTHTCSKCQSVHIARIPGQKFGRQQNAIRAGFARTISVTRYLCCDCGFSEEWIDNVKDIQRLEKRFGSDDDFEEFV